MNKDFIKRLESLLGEFKCVRRLSPQGFEHVPSPMYSAASRALHDAFNACFNHPNRTALGMSCDPFSGVNVALGIIVYLEDCNIAIAEAY